MLLKMVGVMHVVSLLAKSVFVNATCVENMYIGLNVAMAPNFLFSGVMSVAKTFPSKSLPRMCCC